MKNRQYGYIIIGILLIVFNVMVFALVEEQNFTFAITCVFTNIAIIAQIFIWKISFDNTSKLKQVFMGMPVAYVGFLYLLVQFVACCAVLSCNAEVSHALVVYTIIGGIFASFIIASTFSRKHINITENQTKNNAVFLRNLSRDLQILTCEEDNPELKCELQKVLETVKFSDPISNETVFNIEDDIVTMVAKVKMITIAEEKHMIIKEIQKLLAERNIKCKAIKE